MAFAQQVGARLPLVPGLSRSIVTARQTSLNAADCRFARLPSWRLCQRTPPARFRRLRCLGAAQLPGGWGLTGTGLSPASPSGLFLDIHLLQNCSGLLREPHAPRASEVKKQC